MTDSLAPKRLHYAWIVALAFMLMLAGLWVDLIQVGAGPKYGSIVFAAHMTEIIAPFLGVALILWLAVIWSIFRASRSWHARTGMALLPTLLLLGDAVFSMTVHPPSPQRHFRRMFHADLPGDAQSIVVSPPTLADSGNVDFTFACSKQSTLALIEKLELAPIMTQEKSLQFVKVERSGTGYILVTDTSMERVLIYRDALWAKSEEDLTGKAE